jgi:hypothetical protein
VRRKSRAGASDFISDFDENLGIDTGFFSGKLGRISGIDLLQERYKGEERLRLIGMLMAQILLPIDPSPDEVTVEEIFLQENIAQSEKNRRLATRPR